MPGRSPDPRIPVRRYFEEVADGHRLEVADELFAPEFGSPGTVTGPEAARAALRGLSSAFADLRFTIDDLVAEGDRVVARVTYTGIHRGTFLGVEPTGRPIKFTGVEMAIVRDGLIVREAWHVVDHLEILRQLGAEPAAGR
jgi:predicted ester cyclase